eukprot:Gb_38580 [translate_table: standard]
MKHRVQMKFRQAFTRAKPMWAVSVLLNFVWVLNGVEAATTDPTEVEALKAIVQHWSIGAWNFSEDPCSENQHWTQINSNPGIKCDCSENNTCHVTGMKVYALSAYGMIPRDLFKLTHLSDLNLAQNILSGPIPTEFGQLTRMQYLSLGINNLSGAVPQELGKLSNLISLSFSSNKLSGPLPKELGNLKSLQQLYIDSSGVSGVIPPELGNLKGLEIFWASDNLFTGKLPEFIGTLTNLNVLRIGDLTSRESSLSFLTNMKNLRTLSLRNSQISGQIPEELGELSELLYLDLSFNKLTGQIPSSFQNLQSLQFLFLGSNNLTGQLPSQLINSSLIALDISFNHFLGALPTRVDKEYLAINLVGTFLDVNTLYDREDSTTLHCIQESSTCIKKAPQYSSFSVNCGGTEHTSATGVVFEDDSEPLKAASFYASSPEEKWAVSNTGNFMSSPLGPKYTVGTQSQIIETLDSELFQTARISPSSLKYYGVGLENGNYRVELHFAEIVMEDSLSWKSLGRRIFDVYIQRKKELQDFNIHDEAGGSNRALIKTFKANVTENILEIHFLWAGKGTCCIPTQGTYGPLVSAIHVYSDSTVSGQSSMSRNEKNIGKIIGIVIGATAAALILCSLIYLLRVKKDRGLMQVNSDSSGKHEFFKSAETP